MTSRPSLPHSQAMTSPERPYKRRGPVLLAEDVAEIIGANVQTVRRLARTGAIPAYRPPGARVYRFFDEEVIDWIKAHPYEPGSDDGMQDLLEED